MTAFIERFRGHSKGKWAKQNPNDLSGVLCKEFNIRVTVKTARLSFDAINNTETFDPD